MKSSRASVYLLGVVAVATCATRSTIIERAVSSRAVESIADVVWLDARQPTTFQHGYYPHFRDCSNPRWRVGSASDHYTVDWGAGADRVVEYHLLWPTGCAGFFVQLPGETLAEAIRAGFAPETRSSDLSPTPGDLFYNAAEAPILRAERAVVDLDGRFRVETNQ